MNSRRALILDFGGVVTRTLFETHDLTEKALGLNSGTLTWRGPFDVDTDQLWQSMQRDEISERDYWMTRTREVGQLVGETWSSMETFVQRARGAEPELVLRPEARSAIETVSAAGMKLAILSNELDLFYGAAFRQRVPLIGQFDVVVDATYTKILKPDVRAYHTCLDQLELPANACVFVDDQMRNVDGARAIDIPTVHFDVMNPAKSYGEALALLGLKFKETPMRNANFLKENNARHMWHPMANAGEMLAHPPKIITSAKGSEITDVDGHTVLDAVGGLWNVNLGYSNELVKNAIRHQLDALPYYSTFRGTSNAPVIELSYELAEFFKPDGMTRSFFTSGGSDSVETALRLARQYHRLMGQPERTKFFAFKKGYHGTHFGGASVNGNANFRRAYEPLMPGVFHLPAPWTYRNPFNTTDAALIAQNIAALFEDEIAFQGADTIAAIIMEPVLGAGGVIVPHETLMPLLRGICDRHGILMIADEVITAFGRTGAWSGSRLWGVQPDMMCTAKAITNAYYPFGAVMIHEKLTEVFENSKSPLASIGHGYTYSGHPVGAAAALATLSETKRLNLPVNAGERGKELLSGLQELKTRHALVGDVRGKGLMCAVELVSDREKKSAPKKEAVQSVQDIAYANGVMLRTSGPNIILSPPLIITAGDVNKILVALDAGLSGAVT